MKVNPSRRATLALLSAGLAASALPATARPRLGSLEAETVVVDARPIKAFLPRLPDQIRFGSLVFRSGLVLSSENEVFGGFSGLSRSADGSRIVAVSDSAHWLTARLEREGGRLTGLSDASLAPMLAASGRALSRTRSYDTESLCISDGIAYVGVERSHEILRFDWGRRGIAARGQPLPLPKDARDLPRNRGLEGIGIVPARGALAGAVVAIAERSEDHDEPTLGLIIGGPAPGLFRYRLKDGYEATDLAFLPGGDMLVLERWYRPWRGVGIRLRRVQEASLRPGATVEGSLLFDVDLGHEIDNLEGLSVHLEGSRTILTMISDNNFSGLQRTLLLEFELV